MTLQLLSEFFLLFFLASSTTALKFPVVGKRSTSLPNAGAFGNGSTVLNAVNGLPFSYSTNLTVGGVPFKVQIDTGSSDLWIQGNITETQNTTVRAGIGYAIGLVAGHVNIAEVTFDGFTIPDQAYLFAEFVQSVPPLPGILGLGPSNASRVARFLDLANRSDINGAPLLDRIFQQNMTTPNFISFVLERTNEDLNAEVSLLEEQFGQFTIGEVLPGYEENVANASKLPALVDQFGVQHWQTLLDSNGIIGPDGQRIETKTEVPKPTDGNQDQLHVVVDTGFSLAQIPHDIVDAIYGRVPGAEYIKNGSDISPVLGLLGVNDVWRIPCEYELNASFVFAGVEIPVSPLDLTQGFGEELQDSNGVNICFALFQQISSTVAGNVSFGAIDAILGPAFLRNVYTIINFGDFVDGSNDSIADPYIQLIPTLDKAKAHQDFVNLRLGGVDTTGTQAALLPMSQMKRSPSMGGGFATQNNLAELDDDKHDDIPWYKRTRAIVGISIGGAILLIGIIWGVISCSRRRRRNSKIRSEASFLPPMGSYKPLMEPEDVYHEQYRDTAYRPPIAREMHDDGTVKYDPPPAGRV